MIGSIVRFLRDPFGQVVARTNAQQSAARLAHHRRQRQDVDAYFAALATKAQRLAHRGPNPDIRLPVSQTTASNE